VRAALCVMVVAAALAGCGGDDSDQTAAPSSTPPPAPSAATEAPTETPSATASATPEATTQPLPSVSPEDQPGGAGDEAAIRVPAEFTISEGGVMTPQQVAIPAFFTIELIVHNKTSKTVDVRWVGEKVMTVPPGGKGDVEVKGRKKGTWLVDASPAGQAVVITGAKPGP
jgi:hypothetical protein